MKPIGDAVYAALAQGSLWAVMTLGVYISYKILDFADLSVDGTFALGGCVSAIMIVRGYDPFLSLVLSGFAGMLGGAVTGLLNTKLKIPGLLAGILTQLGLYSINMRVMDNSANTSLVNQPTMFAVLEEWLPFSKTTLYLIVGAVFCAVIVLLMYWFFGTEIGCALRATGDNPNMARALGTSTDLMIIVGLVLSNGLVALSGGLVAQSQGYGNVNMGSGTIVIGLASIIIGSSLFRFLRGSFALKLIGAIAGSVIYRVIIAVVLQLGLNTNDLKLLTALMVAIALSMPMLRKRMADYKRRRSDEHAAS